MSQPSLLSPLVIAAPASGSGKTTVTLGLLAALRRRGIRVAPFKVGPDFIDPGHHAAACGRTSRNLDGWMCGEEAVRESYASGCHGAEVAIVEGVMGLFDGACGDSDEGSTAEIARWLSGQVLLVVDARSQARSIAALVKGFVEFSPELEFAGVICNRVGSARHAELLRGALASTPGLPPLLGCLPRDEQVALPERHLGLVTADEGGGDYTALADLVEAHLDLDRLFEDRGQAWTLDNFVQCPGLTPQVRIGVPRDKAFCFYYPENLELLAGAGAELVTFSPLAGDRLPAGLDGLYLGGGYPELYAEKLATNQGLLEDLRSTVAAGLPVYAECGGMLLLAEGIDGYDMAGVLPGRARLLPKRKALGYRQVEFQADTPLGPTGTTARGHEFHYSELDLPTSIRRCYQLTRKGGADLGREGFRLNNLLASYVHLHFGSNPLLADHFIQFCRSHANG
ncbi:MAG: cobyrinic acid a,c-diamide synthase [Desulfuromonas sp.]|nr:MAG: cobyrinic acid a,c-diamide synthase [Desulfuromonas sp.]